MEVNWLSLDDLVMEKIFELLPVRDRFNASLVCHRWSVCFKMPKVWHSIDVDVQWLTKTAVIQDDSLQFSRILNYERVTKFLQRIGHHIRNIYIRPTQDYAILYQFFVLFTWILDNQNITSGKRVRYNIRKILFEFPCGQPIIPQSNGLKLFGIGGQLIGSFKKLLSKIQALRELKLFDLVLERFDANSLMDEISLSLGKSLRELSLVNLTLNSCPIYQIAVMSHLEILELSPQSVDDFTLHLISESNVKHFRIIQNENTPNTVMACSANAWRKFRRNAGEKCRVHLDAMSNGSICCDLLIQPEAPISSVMCKNGKKDIIRKVIDNYKNSIVSFTDGGEDICDKEMLDLVANCSKLSVLDISRPITTRALLILTLIAGSLQKLTVRQSAIINKNHDEWMEEFCQIHKLNYYHIQHISGSVSHTEREISTHLKRPWRFLN